MLAEGVPRRGAAPGTVWIGEETDDEDWDLLSGRWSAHWEPVDGRRWRQGPEHVSATEAIAWGRRHADVVLIRPGGSDTLYSAGTRAPDDTEPWPEGRELPPRRG